MSSSNVKTIGTILGIIVGLGTVIGMTGYVLDLFYTPRDEMETFKSNTFEKLDNLEISLKNLTVLFLKGEIANLNRTIGSLEAITSPSFAEKQFLERLKFDMIDLEIQLRAIK